MWLLGRLIKTRQVHPSALSHWVGSAQLRSSTESSLWRHNTTVQMIWVWPEQMRTPDDSNIKLEFNLSHRRGLWMHREKCLWAKLWWMGDQFIKINAGQKEDEFWREMVLLDSNLFPGLRVGNFFAVSEPQCPWRNRRIIISTLQIVRAEWQT